VDPPRTRETRRGRQPCRLRLDLPFDAADGLGKVVWDRRMIRVRCSALGAALGTLLAVAGCSGEQSVAEAEDDLRTLAFTLSSPRADDPLPKRLDIDCVVRAGAPVDFSSAQDTVTAVFVAAREDCSGSHAASLIIRSGSRHALRVWEEDLKTTLGGPGPYRDQIGTWLKALISTPTIAASQLPPWREGELQPDLPNGVVYEGGVDRLTYETVRGRGDRVFCWPQHADGLTCASPAPRRHDAIILFKAYGLEDAGLKTIGEAVGALTAQAQAAGPAKAAQHAALSG